MGVERTVHQGLQPEELIRLHWVAEKQLALCEQRVRYGGAQAYHLPTVPRTHLLLLALPLPQGRPTSTPTLGSKLSSSFFGAALGLHVHRVGQGVAATKWG